MKLENGIYGQKYVDVASFTEAWIEIEAATLDGETLGSPPSRRRGLKLILFVYIYYIKYVASFTEAWIEMIQILLNF